jgi:alpha/beta superfamily hydrolase
VLKAWPHLGGARAVSLIAPPLNAVRGSSLGDDQRARQIVVGDGDKLVRPDELAEMVGTMKRRPELVRVCGADHFLAGHEREIGKAVAGFLARSLLS